MSIIQPSRLAFTREARTRSYRKLLFAHQLQTKGAQEGTCACGARRPDGRSGASWHVEHLANLLANLP